jgi:CubicO group peptidase (beta-lactamase class C family)
MNGTEERAAPVAVAWATDDEHADLGRFVRPIVEPHVGPARPWGGIPGAAVGAIRGGKQYFFGFGEARPGTPVDRTTVFEIGSITKTFTGLLLADAVRKGRVRLDDPANMFLPERLRLPGRSAKEITLRHLATHRSGLPARIRPFLSDAIDMLMGNREGLSLSIQDLETWLETATLEHDPGSVWSYSNLGSSFLAFALEAREGRPWASLVADVVTSPLRMSATRLMDDTSVPEKALGHTILGRESTLDGVTRDSAYAPAGALRSNMEDMLRFAALHAHAAPSPLDDVAMFAQRAYGDGPGAESLTSRLRAPFESGLLLDRQGDGDVPDVGGKAGGTYGYLSDIRFAPQQRIATVVLVNRVLPSTYPFGRVTKMNEDLLAAIR